MNNFLFPDLLKSAINFIIGYCIGRALEKFGNYIYVRQPLVKLLGTILFRKRYVVIVIPRLYSHSKRMFKNPIDTSEFITWRESNSLFAEGDSFALMHIYNLLIKAGKSVNEIKIKSDMEVTGEDKRGDIICIGAGSNKITKEFLTKLNPPINFEQSKLPIGLEIFGTAIFDRISNRRWSSNRVYDYGLIMKLKNPYNIDASILILAGLGTSATAATGYSLFHNWREIYNIIRMKKCFDKNFIIIIRVKQNDYTDIFIEKVFCY